MEEMELEGLANPNYFEIFKSKLNKIKKLRGRSFSCNDEVLYTHRYVPQLK